MDTVFEIPATFINTNLKKRMYPEIMDYILFQQFEGYFGHLPVVDRAKKAGMHYTTYYEKLKKYGAKCQFLTLYW